MTIMSSMMSILLAAANFHEIAPPVDYSFIPAWAVFLASFVGLSLIGLIIWWFKRKPMPALPPKLPREIALEELDRIALEIETMNPYLFSIRVSDILRRYVTNQYALPVTRQDNRLIKSYRGQYPAYFVYGPLVFSPAFDEAVSMYFQNKPAAALSYRKFSRSITWRSSSSG